MIIPFKTNDTMRLKCYVTALLLSVFALQSCDSDDDHKLDVPALVQAAFTQKYATASVHEWERKGEFFVAEFRNDFRETEAWFRPDGTWVRTETDYTAALPEAVQTYLDEHYAGYSTDDVDWVETTTADYFDIELEKRGTPDVYLKIQADGTLVP